MPYAKSRGTCPVAACGQQGSNNRPRFMMRSPVPLRNRREIADQQQQETDAQKDTMRSTPPACDKPTRNNFATTSATAALPRSRDTPVPPVGEHHRRQRGDDHSNASTA
jgi:hypothetical protein